MSLRAAFLVGALLACALGSVACSDPVHDDAVSALGDENPNVPPGPLHRPGQPCVLCHDGTGPATLVLSFGGTVYQYASPDHTASVGATVLLQDSKGKRFAAATNCAGNFFVQAAEYTPTYPVTTSVAFGTLTSVAMRTHIGRDGSCASCHTGKESDDSVDHVYVSEVQVTFPEAGCP